MEPRPYHRHRGPAGDNLRALGASALVPTEWGLLHWPSVGFAPQDEDRVPHCALSCAQHPQQGSGTLVALRPCQHWLPNPPFSMSLGTRGSSREEAGR